MSIEALNRWRLIYLGTAAAFGQAMRPILILGALCWLAHDLAHARWRAVAGDVLALAGLKTDQAVLTLAGVLLAASRPEAEPSPFIWSRWARPRDTSSAPAAHRSASPDRPAMLP